MKRIKKMVDRTFLIYLAVGVANFTLCTGLMFFLFNAWGVNEHVAPLINYGLGNIIWFLGCKYLIFPGRRTSMQRLLRFAIEIIICYGTSYYIVAPMVARFLLNHQGIYSFFTFGGDAKVIANCEMSVAALFYALMNYLGQRYFVFSSRFEIHKKQNISQ